MERSREKTSLGRVLRERPEQVFCQDLALALVTTVEVYLEVAIYSSAGGLLRNSVPLQMPFGVSRRHLRLQKTPGFSRAVDAAERNGRSGSIIEEFGKGVGGFRKRKCYKVRGRRAVGINISKVIVPASFIVVK